MRTVAHSAARKSDGQSAGENGGHSGDVEDDSRDGREADGKGYCEDDGEDTVYREELST